MSEGKYSKMVGGMLGFGGLTVGWVMNATKIRLSSKMEKFLSSFTDTKTGGKMAWAGWAISLAVYGILAGGGASALIPSLKIGNLTRYVGTFVSGVGVGGLIDELLNPPKLEELSE